VTSCIVDSAAVYIMVAKFRNTICPPPPQVSLHRTAALSSNSQEHGPYIAERTQKEVYIVRCLWASPILCSVLRAGNHFIIKNHLHGCVYSCISTFLYTLVSDAELNKNYGQFLTLNLQKHEVLSKFLFTMFFFNNQRSTSTRQNLAKIFIVEDIQYCTYIWMGTGTRSPKSTNVINIQAVLVIFYV
jgi:hypothetical protein